MELVTKQYIKLDKIDLFQQLLLAGKTNNLYLKSYYHILHSAIRDYEIERKTIMSEVYIEVHDLPVSEFKKVPVKRQTLINAHLFAFLNDDIYTASRISKFFLKREVSQEELGDLLDYILEHSIDINEYLDFEKEKKVYNKSEHKIESRLLYDDKQNKTLKLLNE